MISLLIIGLYLLCTPLMTNVLLAIVGKYPPVVHPEQLNAQGYQAIVVLGGGFYRGEEMHNDWQAGGASLSRLRYAAYVARVTQLPVLISGFEAPAMASTLIQDFGIYAKWQEPHSQNTDQNASLTAAMLLPQGIKKVVLVTDAWHMGRGKLAFEHYGFEALAAATDFPLSFYAKEPALLQPKAALFLMNVYGVSECLGHVQYRLRYLFK